MAAIVFAVRGGPGAPPRENPWLSDEVLLNMAVWWVKRTRLEMPDLSCAVAAVFESLERDLRRPRRP